MPTCGPTTTHCFTNCTYRCFLCGRVDIPDWNDLPQELLIKIAQCGGGCTVARALNRAWKAACEAAATKITIYESALPMNLSSRFYSLTTLDLQGCTAVAPAALSALSNLRHLNSLALRVRVEGLTEGLLGVLRGLPLTSLNLGLGRLGPEFGDRNLESLSGLPLTKLDLYESTVTAPTLAILQGMPLTDLDLGFGRNFELAGIGFLRGMPLRHLSLAPNICVDSELRVLLGLTTLTLLRLGAPNKFSDDALGIIRGLTCLTCLQLSDARGFTEVGLGALEGMQLISLHLGFSGGARFDYGLRALNGMPLTFLGFSREMTDVGLLVVSRLNLPKLTFLNLKNSRITDAGLNFLREMPLTRIDLSGTIITGVGLECLLEMPLTYLGTRDCQFLDPADREIFMSRM